MSMTRAACSYPGCLGDPADHTHAPGLSNLFKKQTLTGDSDARKGIPLARGLLDYFPNALAEVARLSLAANEKHNPGQELHWSFEKSADHADTILRHLVDRGEMDDDQFLHDVKVAWRGLALLEAELIRRGATPGRAAKLTPKPNKNMERSEIAYLVASQLKREGYDMHLPDTLEDPRAKELWAYYATGVVPKSGRPVV